jgi:tRNA(Ile)-lysidine synthase
MDGPDGLEVKLREAWPPETWQDVTVVLAISGGADSVALLRATAALNVAGLGRLVVGHFHHGLRPAADDDERFVTQLSHDLGVPCEIGRADVAASAQSLGDGVESAARQARYEFLQGLAERRGARLVATAHTADDQAETILHHILRGTGLAGLSGMPRCRPLSPAVSLVRPLLSIRRWEVIEYLEKIKQPFREDESNQDRQFTRNRIRHELMPLLEQDYNATAVQSLLRLGRLADGARQEIQHLVDEVVNQCVIRRRDGSLTVDCSQLAGRSDYVVCEVFAALWREKNWPLQSMSYGHWQSLAQMALPGRREKRAFPGRIVVEKRDGQVILRRVARTR